MSTEQCRAGFGAWWTSPTMTTAAPYTFMDEKTARATWIAAKSEASTEPSSWADAVSGGGVLSELRAMAICASPGAKERALDMAIRALEDIATAEVAGALSDDAKAVIDAARKLVQCKGRYHTELNFKELAAAIEAHKAGSGK